MWLLFGKPSYRSRLCQAESLLSTAQSQGYPLVRNEMNILRELDCSCLGHGKDGAWMNHFTPLLPFHSPLDQHAIPSGSAAHGTRSQRSKAVVFAVSSCYNGYSLQHSNPEWSFPVFSMQPWVAGLDKTATDTLRGGWSTATHLECCFY